MIIMISTHTMYHILHSTPNVGDSCLFSYLVILNHLEMDVVQELDLSSESDSSESDGGNFQDKVSVQLASTSIKPQQQVEEFKSWKNLGA